MPTAYRITPAMATAARHHRVWAPTSRRPHPHLLDPGLACSPSLAHQPWCQRQRTSLRWIRAKGDITRRDQVLAVGRECPRHLLLDPDTGLWGGQNSPGNSWHNHISMDELADIAGAPDREHRLTLIFDQSYSNSKHAKRKERAEGKLRTLWKNHDVHGVAYVSHAVFIWVSKDEDLLASATRRLQERSRLPWCRFVQ